MNMEDIPAVVQIDQASFSLPWPDSSFRFEVADNAAARCLVAESDDGQVAAMIVSWMLVDELHIATFATHPSFRRQGMGSALLTEALADAKRLGARRAFLEVRASNGIARELYKKFGFEETGRRPRYYRDNAEDAILMTLERVDEP
jgi:ribosomal-protein-alanine N-acetyltransferase